MFALPASASAVAAAAPAAAASAAASAGIGATLTSIAGNVLMNVAISAAMSIFQPQVGVAGRTFEWTLDPDGPIPFAAGRIGVPGSAVYRKTFGPDLMYYGIPSVLSGAGPIDGFEGFMADDEVVTFDGSGKAVSSQYAGELWYKNKLGTQPDTALTSPTGLKNGATLPGWTSAHKLSGKACYMIVMGENSKGTAFPTGEIKPLITLRGLKVYDPRLDSTYPGGSGAHRLANPATWTYSANPILWALKWTLGLWEGPNGKGAPQVDYQVGGIGAKLSGIDVPAFVAAANVADANGWTCAAYPTTDDDKHQVLTGFLQAGGAIYAQRAGKISCIQRAAPRTSIVTVSAYDTAGPLEIDTAASRIDRINTLRPRFWSEPHRWQMTALDEEVTAQAYRDEDGAVRTRGIDYPYVTNAVQAGQLAALQIANTREGVAGVIPLKPHLQRIRPGDAFTITEPGFVLNGLKCLCLNTDYDPATGVVRVSFVSETDAKYPFALGQNPTPPVPQVLTPVDPRFVSPPESGDWTITPRPPASGGGQLPGFDLSGFVSNETATAIIVETGPTADGPWTQAYQGPPTVTNIPVDGLQPGATYYVAIQYQRSQNYSERHVYGPFTAPALVAEDLSPNSPVVQQIGDILTDVEGLIETYGSTEAAAVSAAAADTARALAQAAEAGALQERQKAHAEAVAAQAAREGSESAAASSVSSAQTASAEADEAGQKAAAADLARAAAATERALAEAARTTAVGAADTATGASAAAGTSAALAARLGFGQALNPNPVFSQTWTSGTIPPGWQDWSGGFNSGDNKRPGVESDNGLFLTVPGSGSAESANRGVYQPSGVGSLGTIQGGGWYVQELTVRLESGTLNGAGMHLQHYDGSGNMIDSSNINCSVDQALTGVAPGAGVVGQVYRYAILFKATAGTKIFVPYAMAFWNGYYGAAPVAKSVTFTKCLVRPATAGEIETGVARNGFGTIHARMANEETVRASETASLSVRQGVLEAKATVLPNLLRNSDGSQGMRYWTSGGAGALWTTFYDAAFGSIFGALGGNNGDTFYLISDMVRVYGSSTYTLSWNGDGGAGPGAVGIYASQFDVNGAYIPAGDGLGYTDFNGVNWTTRKSTTFTTRADCVYLKVVVVKSGYANGNPFNAFVSRIMLNAGATVAGWTDAATTRDLAARTISNEGALATVQGRQTAWAQKRVIAGSAEAFAEMMALDDNGNVTSGINLGAKEIGLWVTLPNGERQYRRALHVTNDRSLFTGDVEVQGGTMNFNDRFIIGADGATTIRSGPTGERMWIEGKTIRGWYANGQQAYQLG